MGARRPASDPAGTDVRRFYDDETFDRLTRVKAQYDPDEAFRANHPIPPAR